jgi:hypothetical protein
VRKGEVQASAPSGSVRNDGAIGGVDVWMNSSWARVNKEGFRIPKSTDGGKAHVLRSQPHHPPVVLDRIIATLALLTRPLY